MIEGQWLLEYPGVSLALGGVTDGYRTGIYHHSAPEFGDVSLVSDDQARARTDGTAFGSDYRGGRTITFDLMIREDTEQLALLREAQLLRAWRGDSIRYTAGALAKLTVLAVGRSRSTYGRPRRIAPAHAARKAGIISVLADFACADDVFYGPQQSVRVSRVPPPSGGFISPVTSPVSTVAASVQSGAVTISGDLRTWIGAAVHGPITNPVVRVTNQWSLAMIGTVAAGDVVTIDPRPWMRSVTRQDGASYAGALTRSSRLSEAWLEPGTYEAVLAGTDATGTAYMDVFWEASYAGLGGDLLIDTTTVETVLQETGGGA